MPQARFTYALKRFYPDLKPISVKGKTVQEVLENVEKAHPGISAYLVNEQGSLRKHVNIFVDNVLIQDREKLSDSVSAGSEVYFFQALSGG